MARPTYLPDFDSPPLEEVVLGVQFSTPTGYSSVLAGEVWGLFKDQFPNSEDKPPLEPSFETFGGANPQPSMQLRFGPAPLRGRIWFISEDQNHLIQFQDDRLLLNWRKRPNGQGYPRFEEISRSYEKYLNDLQNFFSASLGVVLDINQSEVSYINIVPIDNYAQSGQWFRFLDLNTIHSESLNLAFNEIVNAQNGKPFARLTHELQSVITTNGKGKAFRFTLSFRGKPSGNDIVSAMNFIRTGREKIVTRFDELTTDYAHIFWKKKS